MIAYPPVLAAGEEARISTAERERTAAPWPLERRVASGLMRAGGEEMARRALDGLGLDAGDRLVELAPGLGLITRAALAREPRSWIGVEPDPTAREHLERTIAGTGRRVVGEPVDATGLSGGSASAVLVDSLLSTLPAAERAAVLAECARLLRTGGRLALVELAPAPGEAMSDEARVDLDAAGIHPLGEAAWREAAEAAGLVVVGSLVGRLRLTSPRDALREAGGRTALRMTRSLARDGAGRGGILSAHRALERRALDLRAALVVAERPVILGMRRARR